MAAKKETAPLRGAKLVKKAIESAKGNGIIEAPEPLSASVIRKLRLPNGEPVSPAMKEFFLYDAAWLGIEYDEDEGEIECVSLEDVVEEQFGEAAVPLFAEAYEILSDDCIPFAADLQRAACLYIGNPDDAGEYPVIEMTYEGEVARIGGFVPFDVWLAGELGAIERSRAIGETAQEYAGLAALGATANGDGRVVFTPEAGEAEEDDDSLEDHDGETVG